MKTKLLIALVVVVVIIAGACYWFLGTPYYSLYRLSQAVQARDQAGIDQYVDYDSISAHAADAAVAGGESQLRQRTANSPYSTLVEGLTGAAKPELHRSAARALRQEIARAIESPSSGSSGGSGSDSGSQLKLAKCTWSGDTGDAILERADGKDVATGMHSLDLRMHQGSDRRWKIVEVPSLDEYLRHATASSHLPVR